MRGDMSKPRPDTVSCETTTAPAAHAESHPAEYAHPRIRRTPPLIVSRFPDMQMFHFEGRITVLGFIQPLHDISCDIADDRDSRPGRQGSRIKTIPSDG